MNKKSIGALLLSAALLVGASGATFAYFTAETNTNTQNITLGDVKIAFTDNSGNHDWWVVDRAAGNIKETILTDPWSLKDLLLDDGYDELTKTDRDTIGNVAPGDVLFKSFTLQNTGSLDAKVKLSLENMVVKDEKGKVLDNTAKEAFFNRHLFKAYSLNADNTKKDEVGLVVDAEHPGSFILDAKKHEKIAVFAYVLLDNSINNTGMDHKVQFDVKAEATQWNNPGWNQ
jgi:predicted ribosomally synthesized peptide with SipW-like signal peptide